MLHKPPSHRDRVQCLHHLCPRLAEVREMDAILDEEAVGNAGHTMQSRKLAHTAQPLGLEAHDSKQHALAQQQRHLLTDRRRHFHRPAENLHGREAEENANARGLEKGRPLRHRRGEEQRGCPLAVVRVDFAGGELKELGDADLDLGLDFHVDVALLEGGEGTCRRVIVDLQRKQRLLGHPRLARARVFDGEGGENPGEGRRDRELDCFCHFEIELPEVEVRKVASSVDDRSEA
mmetsp:Transcript_16745/g.33490  ORF Transcript_16745/g.33490 Transcript_16745/m.33490 type:complete len:234 (-) Transcript_16745:471-1172(-)